MITGCEWLTRSLTPCWQPQPRHKASREGVEIFMAFWVIFCGRFAHFFTRTKGKWLATSILFPFYSLFLSCFFFICIMCRLSYASQSHPLSFFRAILFFGRVKACVQIFNFFFLALQIPKRTFTPKVNLSYEVRDWISNVTPLGDSVWVFKCQNLTVLTARPKHLMIFEFSH